MVRLENHVSQIALAQANSVSMLKTYQQVPATTRPRSVGSVGSIGSPISEDLSSASTVFSTAISKMASDMTAKVTAAYDKMEGFKMDVLEEKDRTIAALEKKVAELEKERAAATTSQIDALKRVAAIEVEAKSKDKIIDEVRDRARTWQELADSFRAESKEFMAKFTEATMARW